MKHKLRQQENYGNLADLFDLLTKTVGKTTSQIKEQTATLAENNQKLYKDLQSNAVVTQALDFNKPLQIKVMSVKQLWYPIKQ